MGAEPLQRLVYFATTGANSGRLLDVSGDCACRCEVSLVVESRTPSVAEQ